MTTLRPIRNWRLSPWRAALWRRPARIPEGSGYYDPATNDRAGIRCCICAGTGCGPRGRDCLVPKRSPVKFGSRAARVCAEVSAGSPASLRDVEVVDDRHGGRAVIDLGARLLVHAVTSDPATPDRCGYVH